MQAQSVADLCELEEFIGWTRSLRLGGYKGVGSWGRGVFLGGLLGDLAGLPFSGFRGLPSAAHFGPLGETPRGGPFGVPVVVFRPRFVVGFRPRFVVGFRHQKNSKTISFFGQRRFFFWSPVKMRGRKTTTNRGRKTTTGAQNASGLAFWAYRANRPVVVFRPQFFVGFGFRIQFWQKKKWQRGLAWSPSSRSPSVDRGAFWGRSKTRPSEASTGSIWSLHLEGSKGVHLDTPGGVRRGVTWVPQSSRIGGLYDLSSYRCRGPVLESPSPLDRMAACTAKLQYNAIGHCNLIGGASIANALGEERNDRIHSQRGTLLTWRWRISFGCHQQRFSKGIQPSL